MDWLYDTTLEDTRGAYQYLVIKHISDYWFAGYYNIGYNRDEQKYRITHDKTRKMEVRGSGPISSLIQTFIDYIKECNIMDEGLVKHLEYAPKSKGDITIPPNRFLSNTSLSCALDSILSIMFFACNGYFMARVSQSDIKDVPVWMTQNKEKFIEMSIVVKKRLFNLFDQTNWDGMNVDQLQKDISLFIEDDCGDVKVAYEIWGVLASMFQGLSFDVLTKREHKIGRIPVNSFGLVVDEDIVLPGDLYMKPYHLVYINDRIVDPIDFRTFGLYEEIDGYKLVGIVNHTGNHYVSKINVMGDWYSYDDLNAYIKPYSGDVLTQTKISKIVMMFYTKL